jgi:hypothetical protein
VTRQWRGFLLLLAACLAAAACSVSRIAYLNAPPLALWYVGGYFDMSDPQKAFFKERLSRAMAWHRQNELPEYRRAIEALIVKSQAKVEVDDVRAIYGLARNYYYRAVEHLLPDLADFVVQLDERQLGQAERKFADDNRKLVKESVKGTPEERREKLLKKYVDQFEEWTGKLSAPQREIIAEAVKGMADNTEDRLGDRRYRQVEALALARAKPPRDKLIAELRRLLIETDTWRRPEYAKKMRERDERMFVAVSELTSTLTPAQRAHLQDKMRGYVKDISAILASR